jgi:hypothetical protein
MAHGIAYYLGGRRVAVAINDIVDRLSAKLPLATACDRLSIEHWTPADFIA